ncbi:MAG TPA: enoyl-CoA hydratase/isomerase family protein [Bacteroidales bacterium]|mgnify:CR=1 FL=1|nr:enoyl-CoA hydratase/isomerase family protein [Bacteroidales bacterium]
MYQTIHWRIEDNIGFIELNSPPANSMNKLFFCEIHELTDKIMNDDHVKAIIISGAGRHFSSGADINDLLSFDSMEPRQARNFYMANSHTFQRVHTAKIPVIAAIKGVCIGSAMELAMACHFRIAAKNIMMGFPEAGFNLMTGCGGSVYLSEYTEKKTMMELMLKGNNLNVSEAEQLGLIDMVVKKDEVIVKAVNFARQICNNYNPGLRKYYVRKFLSDGQH